MVSYILNYGIFYYRMPYYPIRSLHSAKRLPGQDLETALWSALRLAERQSVGKCFSVKIIGRYGKAWENPIWNEGLEGLHGKIFDKWVIFHCHV